MKKIYLPISLAFLFSTILYSCTKSTAGAEIALTQKMLQDKTWFLDYSITKYDTISKTKTYVGQSTYFINFLKNGTTSDSDGLKGGYTIEKIDNVLQIHVQAITTGANSVEYIYNIESVGDKHLVLYYSFNNQTTKLYYSVQ